MEGKPEPAHRLPEARDLLSVAGWLIGAHGWREEIVEKKRCYYDQHGTRIGGYKSLHKLLARDAKLCDDYFAYREEKQRKAGAAAVSAAPAKKASTKAPAKAKSVSSTSSKAKKAAAPSKAVSKAKAKPAVFSSNCASSSSSRQQPQGSAKEGKGKGRKEAAPQEVIVLDEEEEDEEEVDLADLDLTLETFGEDPALLKAINTSGVVGPLWRALMRHDNRLTSKGVVYFFKEHGTETKIGNASDMIRFALSRRELGYRPIILQVMYDHQMPFFAKHIDSLIDKERQRRSGKPVVVQVQPPPPQQPMPMQAMAKAAGNNKGSMGGQAGVEQSEDEEEDDEEEEEEEEEGEEEEEDEAEENVDRSNAAPAPAPLAAPSVAPAPVVKPPPAKPAALPAPAPQPASKPAPPKAVSRKRNASAMSSAAKEAAQAPAQGEEEEKEEEEGEQGQQQEKEVEEEEGVGRRRLATKAAKRRKSASGANVHTCLTSERYFGRSGGGPRSKGPSEHVELSSASDVAARAERLPVGHSEERQRLLDDHMQSFDEYTARLKAGFHLMLFGVGSKRVVMEQLAQHLTQHGDVIFLDGPTQQSSRRAKLLDMLKQSAVGQRALQLLQGGTSALTPHDPLPPPDPSHPTSTSLAPSTLASENEKRRLSRRGSERACAAKAAAKLASYPGEPANGPPAPHLFLLLCSMDHRGLLGHGLVQLLRDLSCVASAAHIHLVGSVDNVNAPLLWPSEQGGGPRWLWTHVPTFAPYVSELRSADRSRGHKTAAHKAPPTREGLLCLLTSLTVRHLDILEMLAKHQLGGHKDGMSFEAICTEARANWIVRADSALRQLFVELVDHSLLRQKHASAGRNAIYRIPRPDAHLREIVAFAAKKKAERSQKQKESGAPK